MSSKANQLIIHVSPEVLSVALIKKGRVRQTESTELNITDWCGLWADGLMPLDQPIRQLLSRFSTRSFPSATVIYHSLTVTQQVFTSDLRFSEAQETGEIKIRENIGFTNPVESLCLADSKGKGVGSTSLVYSDREENLRSLYAWLNRCGLQANTFIPTSVATIEATADIASDVELETAVFYIGADVSVMAYVNDSGLQLIRSAEIGYRKLVDGYVQGLKAARNTGQVGVSEETDQTQGCKDVNEAFGYLFEHGIPFQPTEVGSVDLRADILPVLAPVLQRFCIEVKQTFRFGLGGGEMPKCLMLCGLGASIPHLSKAISQHIDMHIELAKDVDQFEPGKAFGHGSIESSAAAIKPSHAGLLPEIARDATIRSRLNRSLVAGVGIAALAMGGEYAHTMLKSDEMSQVIHRDSPRLQAVAEFENQLDSVATMSGLISDVSMLITETVEGVPDWYDALVEISSLTSEFVRVEEMRGDYSSKHPVIEINGYAVNDSEMNSGDVLNQFISSLESADGVSGVTLGSTSRISIDEDQWGHQFTMKIELDMASLPHELLTGKITKTNEWGTP